MLSYMRLIHLTILKLMFIWGRLCVDNLEAELISTLVAVDEGTNMVFSSNIVNTFSYLLEVAIMTIWINWKQKTRITLLRAKSIYRAAYLLNS